MESSMARRNRGGCARTAQGLMDCAKPAALNTGFHPTPLHCHLESTTFHGTSWGLLGAAIQLLLNYCTDKVTNALLGGSAQSPARPWSTSSQSSLRPGSSKQSSSIDASLISLKSSLGSQQTPQGEVRGDWRPLRACRGFAFPSSLKVQSLPMPA